jgi:hypothetical protein
MGSADPAATTLKWIEQALARALEELEGEEVTPSKKKRKEKK